MRRPFLLSLALLLGASTSRADDRPPVEIVAHRGASHDAPENTVASFRAAWEQNADGAELDIYLTADSHIVVCHDKNTKRTAGVELVVASSTLAELRTLDVGIWKDLQFAGERIPTFQEMLATLPPDRKVYVEVKCGPEIVPEMVHQLEASGLPPERTPVICFSADVVAAVKTARPDLPAYWLSDLKEGKTAESLIARAREIHADGLDLKAGPELDQAFADKVKAAGLRLDVWTVNDPALARRMVEIGVAGITTDRPRWLREKLAE